MASEQGSTLSTVDSAIDMERNGTKNTIANDVVDEVTNGNDDNTGVASAGGAHQEPPYATTETSHTDADPNEHDEDASDQLDEDARQALAGHEEAERMRLRHIAYRMEQRVLFRWGTEYYPLLHRLLRAERERNAEEDMAVDDLEAEGRRLS
jgi:hypothetical protein